MFVNLLPFERLNLPITGHKARWFFTRRASAGDGMRAPVSEVFLVEPSMATGARPASLAATGIGAAAAAATSNFDDQSHPDKRQLTATEAGCVRASEIFGVCGSLWKSKLDQVSAQRNLLAKGTRRMWKSHLAV